MVTAEEVGCFLIMIEHAECGNDVDEYVMGNMWQRADLTQPIATKQESQTQVKQIATKAGRRETGAHAHGGTRIVIFSTTYSESAYPSSCGM